MWDKITGENEIDRNIIFGEEYGHDRMDKDKPRASLGYLWCIEDNWKLILWYDGQIEGIGVSTPSEMRKKPVRLYSLEKDPHEKDNQAANHPVLVKRLQKEIEAWYPLGERRTLGSND